MKPSELRTPKFFWILLIIYNVPLVITDFMISTNIHMFGTSSLVFTINIPTLFILAWLYLYPILGAIVLIVFLIKDFRDLVPSLKQKRHLSVSTCVFAGLLLSFYIGLRLRIITLPVVPGIFHPMQIALLISSVVGTLFYQVQLPKYQGATPKSREML
jgi:hypothetical protein